jgi:hypothetical protein
MLFTYEKTYQEIGTKKRKGKELIEAKDFYHL